ncbi:uncharacterized protein LOC123540236 [Mercenaria mercenaria]|uniref:uncharacterized protein LOC123540236 n=1 Tax=Mercenaria mercenaria TaxID=6596 RepID=UPI001E1D5CAD|nr:uncharacterized protein LOC123540236 [Mercenaria mercenaria]
MDTRILPLFLMFLTLAVCKHTNNSDKGHDAQGKGHKGNKHHHKHPGLARELLELRNKHLSQDIRDKHVSEREENVLADLKALLAEDGGDSEDMQRRDESDATSTTEDEDERSETESTDELDRRSEDSDDLDLLSLLARRKI